MLVSAVPGDGEGRREQGGGRSQSADEGTGDVEDLDRTDFGPDGDADRSTADRRDVKFDRWYAGVRLLIDAKRRRVEQDAGRTGRNMLERVGVVHVLLVPVPTAVAALDPDGAARGVSGDSEIVEPYVTVELKDDLEC